jgi:hypothetical protein
MEGSYLIHQEVNISDGKEGRYGSSGMTYCYYPSKPSKLNDNDITSRRFLSIVPDWGTSKSND